MAGYFSSSIGRKQVVAVSGLLLVLFLIMHLTGNLLLYKGPEAFNAYAAFLESLGAFKIAARVGLVALFVIHVVFTALLVIGNRRARGGQGYVVDRAVGKRSLATRLMPYTGTFVLAYLIFHIFDYTLADHHTIKSVVDGVNLGLYGLVVNSFKSPIRVAFYVLGMIGIGFHLIHAVQSVVQTFGFNHPIYTPLIRRVSTVMGVAIAVGFASIPLYLFLCGGVATTSVSCLF
jgi:succinate dehydrogenase / fumarate reductase cytochrome b subunit